MIVVETSAIVAILNGETSASLLLEAINDSAARCMSSVNFVETGMVMAQLTRGRPFAAAADFAAFVERAAIEITPADADLARLALDARIRFGKGFGHPARLNFGDSFSYALAKKLNAPLLYVGEDFAQTDIRSALT